MRWKDSRRIVASSRSRGSRSRRRPLGGDSGAGFRELGGRRGWALAWGDGMELVGELSRGGVRLAASNGPGLRGAPPSLQPSLRKAFGGYVARQYPRWLAHPEGDRPPLSVDVGAEFLVPILKAQGRGLFLIIHYPCAPPSAADRGTRAPLVPLRQDPQ